MSAETTLPLAAIPSLLSCIPNEKRWELERCCLPPPCFRFTYKLKHLFQEEVYMWIQFLRLHTISDTQTIQNFWNKGKNLVVFFLLYWISVSHFLLNLEKQLQEVCIMCQIDVVNGSMWYSFLS